MSLKGEKYTIYLFFFDKNPNKIMKIIQDILKKLAKSSDAGKVLLNLHTMPSFETDSYDSLYHRSRGNGNGGNCVDCGTPTFGYSKIGS